MKRILLFAPLLLAACQSQPHRSDESAPAATTSIEGQYDNHEQVWAVREGGMNPPAHVVVAVEPTRHAEWAIWHVRLDAVPPLSAAWAMRRVDAATWLPYRALVTAPAAGNTFDVQQWTPLEACTLRGEASASGGVRAAADVAACSALAPGIGAQAALLPIALDADGEWLRLRLYADQARGAQARTEARRVAYFNGWAAINGGGPGAAADSRDWHMDRNVRLGSEGGRAPLLWRDGKRSGYSLALERLTYRDGNVPVLKLSILDDADGHALAYAWANPQATRIGINLGWVQVGLDRVTSSP